MASSSSSSLVTVTSQHTLPCSKDSSYKALNTPFHLGPLDALVGAHIPVAVVFVYGQPPDAQPIIPVERLQRALTLLLDYYPHLTGRLKIHPNETREVTRLGSGAELYVAECTERLDAFSDAESRSLAMARLPGEGNALLAPYAATLEDICDGPLLTVQHTRFACGGVALGVRTLHTLCDADGFFQLVGDLAELYRGLDSDSPRPALVLPPHIQPYMAEHVAGANMTPEERQEALAFKPAMLNVDPPSVAPSTDTGTLFVPPADPDPVVGRFLHFSSTELAALKAQGSDPNSPERWVSTFDALSAHLYQRVYHARVKLRIADPSLPPLSPPDFLAPINVRAALALPPRYFPNALLCTYYTAPDSLPPATSFRDIAQTLHATTRAPFTTSQQHIAATVRWIAAQPSPETIDSGFRYGNGSLMLSQWNKFDMYGARMRFDGEPALVSPPFTANSLVDGLGYYLPPVGGGVNGDKGAIDVNLALSAPLWEILERDGLILPVE
ncbi:transferase [Mycena rebaudengoi]|nr:transferase [Mycena rebaudengoi]